VLNPAKSTFRGPGSKNQVLYVGKETTTVVGFLANDKPFTAAFPNGPVDGQSHPAPDAIAFGNSLTGTIDLVYAQGKAGKVPYTSSFRWSAASIARQSIL
jgi:hypothetical protein